MLETAAAQAPNALLTTTYARIHVRALGWAVGSSVPKARSTTPASWTMEYPTMCSTSSCRWAATAPRMMLAAPATSTAVRSMARGAPKAPTVDWVQVRRTTARAAGPHAMTMGFATNGAMSARRRAQALVGIAPARRATAPTAAR